MNGMYFSAAVAACFAIAGSANDAYIPEKWAMEGLMRLEEQMVMARLVHRDFSKDIQEFGDVVNTRRPADFKLHRKTDSDNLTTQTATSENVRVPLDQWFTTAFVIKDGERSLSFQELVDKYVAPAAASIARGVDRAILGRIHAFLANRVGRLGKLAASNAGDYLLDARQLLNQRKAPNDGRNLVLSPVSDTAFLKSPLFVSAEQRGDGGSALENAILGRIHGFSTLMSQNVNSITSGGETVTGTITSALAAGGSGSQACSILSYEAVVGEFATVDGNDQPTYITARTASTNTTAVTLNEANKYATLAGATITVFKSCDVNGDYAAGYSKRIVVDGFAANTGPQVGQLIAFLHSAVRYTYTVIESEATSSTEYSILLDRPLEGALSNNDVCFPGPYGSFNWAFHRNSVALVTRTLALPPSNFGVASSVQSYNGVGMRVTMQYDINQTGTVVNFDILAGVAVLDTNLACVLLG